MRRITDDLWETEVERPFPGLTTHAYVLAVPGTGNVLVYNTTLAAELDEIERLGGVTAQYLSHRDEVAPSLRTIKERFGSTLHVAAAERAAAERVAPVDVAFTGREVDGNGIEIVPTPGHSPGSTTFRYRSPTGRTYVFTGDTLFTGHDGTWRAGYLSGISEAEPLQASLRTIATLAPDLVISSAFSDAGTHEVDPAAWPGLVEHALAHFRDVREP